MRIAYDAEVDALYIRFLDTTVTTEHLAEGIAADYAADGGSPASRFWMPSSDSATLRCDSVARSSQSAQWNCTSVRG
ncbi:MAG: DUF2283 domain-containing protein [Chloroflexi bacterium]|nr:DUF2283 domain-containing protein [Chloroflexota bacterium]